MADCLISYSWECDGSRWDMETEAGSREQEVRELTQHKRLRSTRNKERVCRSAARAPFNPPAHMARKPGGTVSVKYTGRSQEMLASLLVLQMAAAKPDSAAKLEVNKRG